MKEYEQDDCQDIPTNSHYLDLDIDARSAQDQTAYASYTDWDLAVFQTCPAGGDGINASVSSW